jgi:hypothetical protein
VVLKFVDARYVLISLKHCISFLSFTGLYWAVGDSVENLAEVLLGLLFIQCQAFCSKVDDRIAENLELIPVFAPAS